MVKSIILIIVIGLAIVFSGCTENKDVNSVVKGLPEVQQFMNEHPNAKMTVTYWSKDEVANSSQEISQQCDKPITPIAMFKATISEGDLKVVSWINAENQIVICSTTQGSGSSQITTSTSTPIPISTPPTTPTPKDQSTGALKHLLILKVSTNLTYKGTPMIKNITFEQSSMASSYEGADTPVNFPGIDVNARINKLDSTPVTFWASVPYKGENTYALKLFFKDGSEPKKGDVLIMPIRIVNNNGVIDYKTTAYYMWD